MVKVLTLDTTFSPVPSSPETQETPAPEAQTVPQGEDPGTGTPETESASEEREPEPTDEGERFERQAENDLAELQAIDPDAFLSVTSVTGVYGKGFDAIKKK